MRLKNLFISRPKFALWLLVALLGSGWYVIDPQARPQRTEPMHPTMNQD